MMRLFLAAAISVFLSVAAFAQSGRMASVYGPASAAPTPTPELKKNDRPAAGARDRHILEDQARSSVAAEATHIYEFTRPGFVYSPIKIEHDDQGKGTITFNKNSDAEVISDPVELSPATLGKIKDILGSMNFLESAEDYQYSRDFSHLGVMKFSLRQPGRERSVTYNWTENKHAKELMDEYRRISNEYTWRFELLVARENQPLFTPGIMESLDSYLRRNEISDPPHLLPFLTMLSTDERLPLMARNRARKMIDRINKSNK